MDIATLDEKTQELAVKITERIKQKGYQCFDRDETFFRYVITSSLNRKPRATVNIDLLCENQDINRIVGTLKSIYEGFVSFAEYVDPYQFHYWLRGLMDVYEDLDEPGGKQWG